MADAPFMQSARRLVALGTSGSQGTAVISSASGNTKGSYIQLSASTPVACDGILVQLVNLNADQQDFLCDIAVGAASSEKNIANNLYAGSTAETPVFDYMIDVPIPAGTRVSARCQCTAASKNLIVAVTLLVRGPNGSVGLQKLTTMGAATGASGGTSIDPGTSLNTKGAYTTIQATTAETYRGLLVAIGNQNQQARTVTQWLLDVAIGAAASEKVIIPDLVLTSAVNRGMMPCVVQVPVEVPAGVRLSARCSSNNTTATKRLFDLILYGISG